MPERPDSATREGEPHTGTDTAEPSGRTPRNNAATGVSAAGARALSAQILAFYFRAPVKAFFRTRVEYVY